MSKKDKERLGNEIKQIDKKRVVLRKRKNDESEDSEEDCTKVS